MIAACPRCGSLMPTGVCGDLGCIRRRAVADPVDTAEPLVISGTLKKLPVRSGYRKPKYQRLKGIVGH